MENKQAEREELRVAASKVAKWWLGWEWREWKGPGGINNGHGWMECCGGNWHPVFGPGEGDGWLDTPRSVAALASPWGMDLLLDAVEERGFSWRMSYIHESTYTFKLFGQHEAAAENMNRYHAIVYAFAKAADALEGA